MHSMPPARRNAMLDLKHVRVRAIFSHERFGQANICLAGVQDEAKKKKKKEENDKTLSDGLGGNYEGNIIMFKNKYLE